MAFQKPRSANIAARGGRGQRSLEEYRWWKNAWQDWPVLIERGFNVDSFNVNEFPQSALIKARAGWSDYLKRPGNSCNISVCTEFMAGLLPFGQNSYSYEGYLRSHPVALTPIFVQSVMDIEPLPEGEYEFPYEVLSPDAPTPDQIATLLAGRPFEWPRNNENNYSLFAKNDLHKDFQVLWFLVCNSLMPTSQHNFLNLSHARVMEALINGRNFCLVRFFIQQIAAGFDQNNRNQAIKLGMLITELCDDQDIVFNQRDVRRDQKAPIDKRTYNRMMGQLRNRPQDQAGMGAEAVGPDGNPILDEEAEDIGTSSGRRQKRRATTGPVPLDMNAMMEKLEEMQAMSQSHYTALDASHQQYRDRYNTDIGEIGTGIRIMGDRVAAMNTRMGLYEDRLDRVDNRMDSIDGRVGSMQQDLTTFREDVNVGIDNIEDQLQRILNHFQPPPNH